MTLNDDLEVTRKETRIAYLGFMNMADWTEIQAGHMHTSFQ